MKPKLKIQISKSDFEYYYSNTRKNYFELFDKRDNKDLLKEIDLSLDEIT